MKNEHVIVMALGNISLAQGIDKQLGYFGQSTVQMFWLWSKGSKRCFQFYPQAITTAPLRGNFSEVTRGTVFPFRKVVSSLQGFWTAISCSLFNFTENMKY